MHSGNESVEPEENESDEAQRAIFRSAELSPEGDDCTDDAQEAEDRDVCVLSDHVAVESVVVGRDAGPRDKDDYPSVVQANKDVVHCLRVAAEEMEERGDKQADHDRQEEAEQHGLVDDGQLVHHNAFKDVVAVHVGPQIEDQEEYEPEKVCPYVPRLGVHAEHAQETAQERVHRRTVIVGQVLVVL